MMNIINPNLQSSMLNRELVSKQNDTNKLEKRDVETSKFETIKEQVKNGEYDINLRKTAEKMASDLLNA